MLGFITLCIICDVNGTRLGELELVYTWASSWWGEVIVRISSHHHDQKFSMIDKIYPGTDKIDFL